MTKFSLKSLAESLTRDLIEEATVFKDHEVEYDDGVAVVNGTVFIEYQYIKGDFWTPPDAHLLCRWIDLRVEFNGEEFDIDELIYKENKWI